MTHPYTEYLDILRRPVPPKQSSKQVSPSIDCRNCKHYTDDPDGSAWCKECNTWCKNCDNQESYEEYKRCPACKEKAVETSRDQWDNATAYCKVCDWSM